MKTEAQSKRESRGRNWYVVQTTTGYENAVEKNLRQRISSMNMDDKIFNVLVPVEKKVKIRNGKKYEAEERIYPGYVLVDMIVDDEAWYVVRNTPRVSGFVGTENTPVPVSPTELEYIFSRMNDIKMIHEIKFKVGDMVNIVEGPFKDSEGEIGEIDRDRGRVKVLVNMFGRKITAELDVDQVKEL